MQLASRFQVACKACGLAISPEAKACPGCGHPAPPSPSDTLTSAKNVVGVIGGLLIAGLVLFVLFGTMAGRACLFLVQR